MSTESRAKASAKYRAALLAAGHVRKTFILSPVALKSLAKLAAAHGSETKALEALLGAVKNVGEMGPRDTVKPVQPTPKTVARKGKTGDNAGEKTVFFQDVGNAERIVRGNVSVDPKSMIERGPMTPKTLTPGRANPKPGKGTK